MSEDLLKKIRPDVVDRWGDPAKHPETSMSREGIEELLTSRGELFLSHLTSDGFPMVTVHFFVHLDGAVWTTTVRGRAKEKAFRRDPRTCLCISNGDLTLTKTAGLAIKAHAQIFEDRETVRRICEVHGAKYFPSDSERREKFFTSLYTSNRLAIRFEPIKIVSWDLRQSMRRPRGSE